MEESQYYILYNDGTKSIPHILDELSCIEGITKETLIIKDNDAPKPAAAFIDFTDNRQTRLPDELNTFNIGACLLAPLWGYIHLPKYRLYWWDYIIVIIFQFLFLRYIYMYYCIPEDYLIFMIIWNSIIHAITISIIYLIKGNEIAWRNRKFRNIEQFKAVQKKWKIWGYCLLGLYALYIIYSFFPNY